MEIENRQIFAVLLILIVLFNLAEQIGVYFISKENDLDENAQQRFFFVLFGVGFASICKPIFIHPILITIYSMAIEVGELVAYLTLLQNTTSLLVVTILFFVLQVILHVLSLFSLYCDKDKNSSSTSATDSCSPSPGKWIYGAVFETQIAFLFLDPQSPFRGTFYEIMMILSGFSGLYMVEKSIAKCCARSGDDKKSPVYVDKLWEAIMCTINVIVSLMLVITSIVYASQLVQQGDQLKTYDFVIYVIILVVYSSILATAALSLALALSLYRENLRNALNAFFKDLLPAK